jgi:predicted dehydrogenase
MQVLKLGIIGLGMAVTRIFQEKPGIPGLPYVKITAGMDPRQQALDKFKEEFGGETYTDVEAICKSPNVDAVYIATPPELHAEQTLIAARNGKHVIIEKPMAMTIEECEQMNATADQYGIKLLAGHTASWGAPIQKMRDIVRSGELGALKMINTWNFNEFNHRPWPSQELVSTHGPLLNQGPHQVDVVRLIGGGMVKSVRAQTVWDDERPPEGGWTAFLEFENGVPATLVYDARGFFDTSELFWWIGEGGQPRDPETNLKMRRNMRSIQGPDMERVLNEQKDRMRYGGDRSGDGAQIWGIWGAGHERKGDGHQPFFGLTVVSCEKGAMRQSPDGLFVYGAEEKREITLGHELTGRQREVTEIYEAVVNGKPMAHDGRWGEATLEVCLAIMQSARESREIKLSHQVPVVDAEWSKALTPVT